MKKEKEKIEEPPKMDDQVINTLKELTEKLEEQKKRITGLENLSQDFIKYNKTNTSNFQVKRLNETISNIMTNLKDFMFEWNKIKQNVNNRLKDCSNYRKEEPVPNHADGFNTSEEGLKEVRLFFEINEDKHKLITSYISQLEDVTRTNIQERI